MNHARTTASVLGGLTALLIAAVASAEPRTHDGFFLRLGADVGPGLVTLSPSGGTAPDIDVSSVQVGEEVLAGGTLAPGVVVGGGPFFVHAPAPSLSSVDGDLEYDGAMISLGVMLFANYYFDPELGLHVQGLAGYGLVDFLSDETFNPSFAGPMVGVGVGYDIWLGDEWSVGPFGRFVYGALSSDNGSARYVYPSLGGALTFH